MKIEFDLTSMLEAINNTIVEAHRKTGEYQVEQLGKYFAADGTALSQPVNVTTENGAATVHVPLLSMLPPNAIRMKEVNMHLRVPVIRVVPGNGPETEGADAQDTIDKDYMADLHICYEGISATPTIEKISELLTRNML